MTDTLSQHERDLILVNREANRVDDYLKNLGAEGRGLGERAQSLDLPDNVQRQIKTVSFLRNRVVHDSQPLTDRDRQRFQSAVDEAVRLLENRGGRRYSPPPPQRTSGQQATYAAPAPVYQVRSSGAWLRFPWLLVALLSLVPAAYGLMTLITVVLDGSSGFLTRFIGLVMTLVCWLFAYVMLRWVRRR